MYKGLYPYTFLLVTLPVKDKAGGRRDLQTFFPTFWGWGVAKNALSKHQQYPTDSLCSSFSKTSHGDF
ncbi:hypothetical protein XENTR_v10008242 [Xenopus tropicalis]|nr:hypothetical protein XENTR_v10008242 [Xenopus tropicalis]